MRFISRLLLGMWPCLVSVVLWSSSWSVCQVVVVLYVDAVVTVTVMRVLLFVLHVCMLRKIESDSNAGVGGGGEGGVVGEGVEEVWLW